MTTTVPPICLSCRHLDLEAMPDAEQCTAFPSGIPRQIWENEHDHRDPYPGDSGIRFSQKPGFPRPIEFPADPED